MGSPQNLSVPLSAVVANLRAALVARGVLNDEVLAAEDADQTLRLALTESQADLPIDRAALRLAAMEFVIRNAAPIAGGKTSARSAGMAAHDRCTLMAFKYISVISGGLVRSAENVMGGLTRSSALLSILTML